MYLQDIVTQYKSKELAAVRNESTSNVLSKNIVFLGLTSLVTDISSEMVLAIAPLYLTSALGFSFLGYGLFDSAYQLANGTLRIWGGTISDKKSNHKSIATKGYLLSALTKVGLFLSYFISFIPVTLMLISDRIGKGLRVAPRDALISMSSTEDNLAKSFAIHRTMDATGAMLGPIVAYAILKITPGAFNSVFFISSAFALFGVSIIHYLVKQPEKANVLESISEASNKAKNYAKTSLKTILQDTNIQKICLALFLLSSLTLSDAFIYLIILNKSTISQSTFPLLFSGTAVVYIFLAIPFGKLADKFSRIKTLLLGQLFIALSYLLILNSDTFSTLKIFIILGLLGAYYAATEGIAAAIVSSISPVSSRATSIAVATVSITAGKIFSALFFGILWQQFGITTALWTMLVCFFIVLILAGYFMSEISITKFKENSNE